MFEAILSFVSKVAGGFVARMIGGLVERLKRLKIALKRAPKNIFEQIAPGTSIERMKELLGAPHRESEGEYSYTFRDALVQIRSEDRRSVLSIAVALPTINKKSFFPVYPMGFVLGKQSLHDVLTPESTIIKDNSSKHWCFWVREFYGFSGMYRYFTYGIIDAPCIFPPPFEWDYTTNQLKSDPRTVLVNWVCVSKTEDVGEEFNFWAFL